MVKEFELDPLADVWIFVDAKKAANAALPYSTAEMAKNLFILDQSEKISLPPATEEYAASIAASQAHQELQDWQGPSKPQASLRVWLSIGKI